ncbi:MAG: T9SS type A sorting domain-containing protein [Ignavibacterium sp.]|nr:T9SS type A sorting domain-containing protein [Ignavibacterium sp.]
MLNSFHKILWFLMLAVVFCSISFAQDARETSNESSELPVRLNYQTQYFEGGEDILFDNGPLVNLPGGGAGGADASVLQSTSLLMTTIGFGHQQNLFNYMVDDFEATASWSVDSIKFYAYQTGSTTTSTITGIYLQIWNGPPNAGGTVVWGDTVTNRLAATRWSGIYRVTETTLTATNRPIFEVVANVAGLNLSAGTYWLEWGMTGSLASGPWAPPITIAGQNTTGNGLQRLSGVYNPANDGGSLTQQGLPFIVHGTSGAPTGPGPATNPSPANGATNVPITASQATWTNPAGATSNEFYFGTAPGSLTLLQSGSLATSFNIPPGTLQYASTYYWRVNEIDGSGTTIGPIWSFTTEQNPLLVQDTLDVYPQNLDYWTGTSNTTAKTDVSEVRTLRPELGWMVFDVSAIPASATILSSSFNAYVNANNWPWWSVTPMGAVNPITADAATIYAQADANTATGVAYVFSNEGGTLPLGWINRPMGNTANPDLQAALSQGWFAVGVVDRDVDTYFINFDGWNQPNKPYLTVVYEYIIPVELTSFTAAAVNDKVTLNWSTATETNNQGFFVERSNGNEFASVGFVDGKGTTTEVQNYSFTDAGIAAGSYTYRLKQVDFDGTFEYSSTIEVEVLAPREFALNQNFPNPFNPSTMISFSLLVDAKVSLKVFDILGQEVMTIVNNNLSAGAHEYTFDASNFNSGVYFYRIEATGVDGQNFTSVKKMILTK